MTSASEDQSHRGGGAAGPAAHSGADAPELPQDWLVVAAPHVQLRGDSLASIGLPDRRRLLSTPEIDLWNLMQRPVTVREAAQRCGPGAELLIRGFLRDKLCVLIEASFPAGRRRVLVIEPHGDDAVLSVGGTMWLRRHECAFVIATMASRTNHSRYRELHGNPDIHTVSEIRRRESDLAAMMLGGSHISVGMTDAPLRYRDTEWAPDFYRRHRMIISASISRIADEPELRRWIAAVQALVSEQQPAEIWFPLGGPHTDHMLAADACLAAFATDRSLIRDRVLRIYQEVPYTVRYPRHMESVLAAVTHWGARLEKEVTALETVLSHKRRLSSLYDSQDMDHLFAAGGELPEVFWRVKDLPPAAEPGIVARAVSCQVPEVDSIAAWVRRNRAASLVRVLLTRPTGRWHRDLEVLGRAFPRARFEVWTSRVADAEVTEIPSERVDIRTVDGGAAAWLLASLRLCVSRPAPTLVHASAERVRRARQLSSLWPGSDTVVLASMDHLSGALRIAGEG
jgi:LmbE family N-acetylglucosaminyl deacetylase